MVISSFVMLMFIVRTPLHTLPYLSSKKKEEFGPNYVISEEDKIWLDGPDGSGSIGQQGTGPTLTKVYRWEIQ